MPTFSFTSPQGQQYDVTGPDGSTLEQAVGILRQHLAQTAPLFDPSQPYEAISPSVGSGSESAKSPTGRAPTWEDFPRVASAQNTATPPWQKDPIVGSSGNNWWQNDPIATANKAAFGSDDYSNALAQKYNADPQSVKAVVNSQAGREFLGGVPVVARDRGLLGGVQ